MKITAFAASNSSRSINKQFVEHTLTHFPEAEINLLDLNNYDMPLFSVDRESNDGYPQQARDFLKQFEDTDLVIVSMAEHNGNCTAAFKNLLDWSSRIELKVFNYKPLFLTSTSPGKGGAKLSLAYAETRFPRHSAQLLGTFSLPSFNENFSPEAGILDEALKAEYLEQIAAVKGKLTF